MIPISKFRRPAYVYVSTSTLYETRKSFTLFVNKHRHSRFTWPVSRLN